MKLGGYIGIRLSVCHTFTRKIIYSVPLHYMQPNLAWKCIIMNPECRAKRLSSYLHGQGDSAGSNPPKITVSSIYLLNFLTLCYLKVKHDILVLGVLSRAGVFCCNFCLMSPWRSLCTLYSSHARWSYRRRLGSLLLWACVQCHVWRQLFERNYFPLFVDSAVLKVTVTLKVRVEIFRDYLPNQSQRGVGGWYLAASGDKTCYFCSLMTFSRSVGSVTKLLAATCVVLLAKAGSSV